MTPETTEMLHVLTGEDIEAINAARRALLRVEEAAKGATPPDETDTMSLYAYGRRQRSLGRLQQTCAQARDRLFNVLNVAQAHQLASVPSEMLHLESLEQVEGHELVSAAPDKLRDGYEYDEPGPDLSMATEHDPRL